MAPNIDFDFNSRPESEVERRAAAEKAVKPKPKPKPKPEPESRPDIERQPAARPEPKPVQRRLTIDDIHAIAKPLIKEEKAPSITSRPSEVMAAESASAVAVPTVDPEFAALGPDVTYIGDETHPVEPGTVVDKETGVYAGVPDEHDDGGTVDSLYREHIQDQSVDMGPISMPEQSTEDSGLAGLSDKLFYQLIKGKKFSQLDQEMQAEVERRGIKPPTKPTASTRTKTTKVTKAKGIYGFKGKYRFLSNFWPAVVEFEGAMYPSVEHAFQASKTLDLEARLPFQVGGAHDKADFEEAGRAAKAAGKKLALDPEWDTRKIRVMSELVRQKFERHPELAEKLLATGDLYIEETNTHGDTYWGVANGVGKNLLGKILMRVRSMITPEDPTVAPEAATEQEALPWFDDVIAREKVGKVASFIGHRPKDFSFGYKGQRADSSEYQKVREAILKQIDFAYENGCRTFIVGMAQGVDTWAASLLLSYKKTVHSDIKIIAAVAMPGQESKWTAESQAFFKDLLRRVDAYGYVSTEEAKDEKDAARKLAARSKAMIDASNLVLAVYNGKEKGGTANSLSYAHTNKKPLLVYNPKTEKAVVFRLDKISEEQAAEPTEQPLEPMQTAVTQVEAPVGVTGIADLAAAFGLDTEAIEEYVATPEVTGVGGDEYDWAGPTEEAAALQREADDTAELTPPTTPEEAEAVVEKIVNKPKSDQRSRKKAAQEVIDENLGKVIDSPVALSDSASGKSKGKNSASGKSKGKSSDGGRGKSGKGGSDGQTPSKGRPEEQPYEPYGKGPFSKAFQRAIDAIKNIKEAYETGYFWLSGDTLKKRHGILYREHSPEVKKKIEEAFRVFGREYKEMDEIWFFRAFIIYRGFSPDRNNLILNKKPDKVAVSDEKFIEFLDEIIRNTRGLGHPFAYSNHTAEIGGTLCYPVPTTRDLAKFFTEKTPQDGNTLKLGFDEFVKYSMNEYVRDGGVKQMLEKADVSQQVTLTDLRDFVLLDWGSDPLVPSGLAPRPVNSLVSGYEIFDLASEYSRSLFGDENLASLMLEQKDLIEDYERSMEKINKRLPSSPPKRKRRKGKRTVSGKDIENMHFIGMSGNDAKLIAQKIVNYARTAQIFAMFPLAPTGIAEHGMGVVDHKSGQKLLSLATGCKLEPTKWLLDFSKTDESLTALERQMGLLVTRGVPALFTAGKNGVKFTAAEDVEKAERIREFWTRLSVGDVAFRKAVAKIFMRHLVYQFERSEKIARKEHEKDPASTTPILHVTPELLESIARTNPDSFWYLVATTEEGQRAVHYAADTSLSGIDPLTMALRKTTMDPRMDLALSFFGGLFLRYAIRSMLRKTPFSMTLLYIAKRGKDQAHLAIAGVSGEEAVERAKASIAESNLLITGGADDFWNGLGQVLLVDIARAGTQLGVVAIVAAALFALGRGEPPEPPDDPELEHLWYEYKVDGRAFKTNWYWTEILGATMPVVISAFLWMDGDHERAKKVLRYGIAEEIENNQWANVADTLDLVLNYDYHLAVAQARSEGIMNGEPVSDYEYMTTTAATFLGRRLYSMFEPGVLRLLWNEAGLFSGREQLAHSTTRVYTQDPNDTEPGKPPKTVETSWSDAQIRKMAYNSPLTGLLLNVFRGYFINNDEVQRTGYLKHQMPLVTNADPYQIEMMNDLVVLDEDGNEVPYDKWTEAQREEIGSRVLEWVEEYSPSDLADNGVVLPYDARKAAMSILDDRWAEIEDEYYDRVESGEFWSSVNGLSYEENYVLKNQAWEEKDAQQDALYEISQRVWSDEIPYRPTVYNRWETTFRPLYTWNENSDTPGAPATKFDWWLYRDKVDISVYASGDHKSSLLPFLVVDDRGENTYNAETPLAWQGEYTEMDFVKRFAEGNRIAKGMNQGEDLWSVIGPGINKLGRWDDGKLVMGIRAMLPVETVPVEVDPDDKKLGKDYERKSEPKDPSTSVSDWRLPRYWSGGGGGGGGYVPNIYSHPAYSLNAQKAAALHAKNPEYIRFDYLRPSVSTKGSREAYRREDF